MTTRSAVRSSIEPLEARIAPALLVNGANLLGGAGNPSTGETSVGDNSVQLVKVTTGQAVVWFDNGEILSISFGPNASIEVKGDVLGDVVGNLNADGTLSDSDNDPTNGEDGAKLLANNLLKFKTTPLSSQDGSLGNVITGGSISGLSISGEILGAYAGDGVFRAESDLLVGGSVSSQIRYVDPETQIPTRFLDINPVESGTQSTFVFTKVGSVFQAGASIKSSTITRAPGLQLFAGSGNPTGATITLAGAAGGSISGITLESALVPAGSPIDTPSYWLLAGDGSNGKTGGAGGSITQIVEKTSFGPVILTAGNGGNGTGGAGGAGGSIAALDVQSNSANYILTAGNGGNGAPGGAGGQVTNNNFTNRTPVSGIVVGGDFTGDGIDDVLVVDAATGQMIISTQDDPNPGDGVAYVNNGTFNQLVQFKNSTNVNVVLIDPSGVSPSDATAVDVDGDGNLDILVAYKNSNNLAVFLNQGEGVFFDPNLGTTGEYAAGNLSLGFAPAKLLVNSGLVIAENTDGKGILHYGQLSGSSIDTLQFDLSTGSNEFARPVADLVSGNNEVIVGFTDGVISRLQTLGIDAPKPFSVAASGITIIGGITDLEVDSTGDRLLALSKIGRTVEVIDISAASYVSLGMVALSATVDPLVAHFVRDGDSATEDDFTVLGLLPSGSVLTTYAQAAADNDPTTIEAFSVSASLRTSTVLKNFVPLYNSAGFLGDAALAGSNNSFTFTADLLSTKDYALPFASKVVQATAGAGGNGLDLSTKLIGKGGAGGSINGINADANEINLTAGAGGSSVTGAAGAGGSVQNPATFTTASGSLITPQLLADVVLDITAGNGGAPSSPGKTASGGAGGSLSGLTIILEAGDITLGTGQGGNGRGGNAGAGGNFGNVTTLGKDGSLTVNTGKGGDALGTLGAGGAGGSVVNFRHDLTLDPATELLENKYSVTIGTGAGGSSVGGIGGAGGIISGASLQLDGSDRTYTDNSVTPPLADAQRDSTVRIKVTTGVGGAGATGGAGGLIRDLFSTSVFDQKKRDGSILGNYVVAQIIAGAGGTGSAGGGGAGGAINFVHPVSGITFYDPDAAATANPNDPANLVPFIARAGAGGNGSTKGGAGGAVTGLTLQNAKFSSGASLTNTQLDAATINAGNGGNGGTLEGGAGGAVSGATIGTQGGYLFVRAGDGGTGGTKGGVGGAVASSTFGVVSTFADLGLAVRAGHGGAGASGGGVGGALSGLQISTPQSTDGISAVLYSGDGGAASSNKGAGGKGGDILSINQLKDINSSINLIQAGNGGDNAFGTAGAGGNITGIKTVGFIGRPSDGTNRLGVFDQLGGSTEIPQGLFSGRGGAGLNASALNGAITNIAARQIAAIAAAVDANDHFGAASKITTVKTALIGFDVLGNGVFNGANPGTARPTDGFIFGTVITGVTNLPTASYLFTS